MLHSINLISPINKLSYGYASVNILDALSRYVKVALWTIGGIEVESHQEHIVVESLKNAKTFDYDAPALRIYHQHSLDTFPGRGQKIGFPIFELDSFNEVEKHNLEFPDKLFVCSDWAKAIVCGPYLTKAPIPEKIALCNKMYDNTHVVPLGVDNTIFSPSPITNGPTIFLNIGKWEIRKGHNILIQAFKDEFKEGENVNLLLATHNYFLKPEQIKAWTNMIAGHQNIHIIHRKESVYDISDLISISDCGVYPSRAEGWNMPALETLACGRHLIITDYSAHKMYANSSNARMIDIDKVEPAYDGIWFNGQGNWASIEEKQVAQLRQHMREVHELKQSGKLHVNDAGINTAKQFTWDNSAKKILENL